MSAWMVSRKHIDYMLSAALKYDRYGTWLADPDDAAEVGAMLEQENRASVRARYTDADTNWPVDPTPYTFTPVEVNHVQALKALDCYEYQACEHDGWQTSGARQWCDGVRRAITSELPGYDAAKWGID